MVKIKNLKVSSKLSFIIFISTISMIIIGIIGYSQMDKMSKHIDEIYNNSMLSVQTMDNIESNFHAQDAYLLEFVMTNDEEKHNKLNEKLQKNIQDNEKMMKLYEQTKKTSDEQKVYEAFKSDLTVYAKKVNEIITLGLENRNEDAHVKHTEELLPLKKSVTENLKHVGQINEKMAQQAYEVTQQSAKHTLTTFILVILSTIIALVILGYVVAQMITRPIQSLEIEIGKAAKGDLTARATYKSKDEIGHISESFNETMRSLSEILGVVKQTVYHAGSSTDSMLLDIKNVSETATTVRNTMEKINKHLELQDHGIQENAAAMNDMAIGVQQVSESAATVSELAVKMNEDANAGKEIVNKSIVQMEEIHDVVKRSLHAVQGLEVRTQNIDKAIEAIAYIAEQTNLLALNASIEAARAGEHGRGFAIVADEVRKLAEQSKDSTIEINRLLKEIEMDVKNFAKEMQIGQQETVKGMSAIETTSQTFDNIVTHINGVVTQIQEVSSSTEEMSAGIEEVSVSFSDISSTSQTITQENIKVFEVTNNQAKSASEVEERSLQTIKIMNQLQKQISQFKTKEE
ncbi:methyl-accepting chemotaxis protein [Bacillus cytotoxicus]|uniref:HAMP domain protein n=1 Tax=Bacillus cytotoxicus TaxID=580165 RepID=A0AAX2CCH0_9BACI|nr:MULTISPECIES: methyl-accepting chemotaxis protein [Bacillus cereus group]AWC31512.1 methyl-accepting chemotaxis protein [Bacillus cytotoxicus]AWC35551.1 methyl-accepting chemotaxis protein [Bacillus cytotoxicus]AWC59782.1 methyl-accepting chemotaxis protein [Bacillus cytotoxicus]KMT50019.1 hypothetical protein TU51_11585 [Bacillus cytotoxicus]QTR71652.1 methyl-accepting chemotaxis protein [Bacillus cytotoxicus]